MTSLRTRIAKLERYGPATAARSRRRGPQTYIGPCTRYSVEQPAAWRPGDPQAFVGLEGWLAGRLPPRPAGTAALFRPPHKRLVACSYIDEPGVPAGGTVRAIRIAGVWPAPVGRRPPTWRATTTCACATPLTRRRSATGCGWPRRGTNRSGGVASRRPRRASPRWRSGTGRPTDDSGIPPTLLHHLVRVLRSTEVGSIFAPRQLAGRAAEVAGIIHPEVPVRPDLDPAYLTPDDRLRELAAILVRGVCRLRDKAALTFGHTSAAQIVPDSSDSAVAVPSDT